METDHKLPVFLDWDIYVALRLLLEYFAISLQSQCLRNSPVCYINLHCFLGQKPKTLLFSTHAVAEGKNLNPTAHICRLSMVKVPNPS